LNAYAFSPVLWAIGSLTAVLTAYLHGPRLPAGLPGEQRWVEARPANGTSGHGGQDASGYDPHDPSWVMSAPLVVSGPCRLSGSSSTCRSTPTSTSSTGGSTRSSPRGLLQHRWSIGGLWYFAIADGVLALVGVGLAIALWAGPPSAPPSSRPCCGCLVHRLGLRPFHRAASTEVAIETSSVVETKWIDGVVNGVGAAVRAGGRQLRKVQTGYVRNYALGLTAGLVLILAYVLTRAS